MDSTAVDRIAQLGVEAANANILNTDTPAVIVTHRDGTQNLMNVEYLQAGRSRYRGLFRTQSLQAFADYVTTTRENDGTSGQAQGFIDPKPMVATVFFNLGDNEHPGHGDHIAQLNMQPTAAFAALNKYTGIAMDQRTLHDFIEDWRDNITPVTEATTGIAGALAAIRAITIDTARSTTHVDRDMGATRSAMESVDAKSKLILPSGFQFKCVPYDGLQERTFNLRLGVNTGGDKPTLVLRVQQAEATTEAIAKDFAARLGAQLGTASTLVLGTFTP